MISNINEVKTPNDIMAENDSYLPDEIINNNNIINSHLNNDDYEENININNKDIESTQEAFIQTLNLQIKQLQELLDSKNKDFDNLNSESNKLKMLLIQEQKQLIDKDNIIHSINLQKKNLEEQLNKKNAESENMKNKIKELNYKLIELNQSLITKENIYQFNNRIKNVLEKKNINNDNQNQNQNDIIITENYEIELKRLSNLVDELEIKNNKLLFDNKALNSKIDTIINDKNSELNLYKYIYQNKINNLNKAISNLNNRISQLLSEQNNQKNVNKYNNLLKKDILQKFNELENKLNGYDKENCALRQENQNIKSELEELKLVTDSKEKIIQKLQSDFEIMENEYNNNLLTTQKVDENLKKGDLDKTQYINELQSKQEKLNKENKDLKFGLKQMTKNINEANQLYFKKKAEYDKTLSLTDNKLKEYKKKIVLLKMKINELHQEIKLLKEYKGVDFLYSNNNNQYSFLTQMNIDNNNQNKQDYKKFISYTPKARKNKIPFEINLENNNENLDGNDIFGDIKISEVPKDNNSMKPPSIKKNNDLIKQENNSTKNKSNDKNALANNEQDLKFIQEYKDNLNKMDEQLKKLNS